MKSASEAYVTVHAEGETLRAARELATYQIPPLTWSNPSEHALYVIYADAVIEQLTAQTKTMGEAGLLLALLAVKKRFGPVPYVRFTKGKVK